MKIKRFFAKDMRSALAEVKRTLGPEAVIMSNKTVSGGIELVAAYDPDTAPAQAMSSARRQNTVTPIEELAGGAEKQQAIANSLEALLQRQQEEAAPHQAEALEQQPVAEPVPQAQPAPRPEPSPEPSAPSLQEPVAQVAGQMVAETRILNDAQVAERLAAQDSQMET